ncbi:MAG: potassium/proton antiporter [Thermoguttaceae bacterium]|nr:potassium/proton antiporter [Thermoguttaceae bacterium]
MVEDLHIFHPVALISVLLLLGIFASKISSWIKIPTLLMIMLVGMLAGTDGLGKIPFRDFTEAAHLGTIALLFILFSGGYDTSWKSIRKVIVPGTLLCTVGVACTAALVALFAVWYMKMDWRFGLLLGSVISSTDAAAVFSIFQSESTALKGNLRPILEMESGSNDPMAAFLTFFVIYQILGESSWWSIFYEMPLQIGVGALVGFLVGRYTAHLINHVKLDFDGLYYVIGVATVLLSYSLTEICHGNGFMGVYVCGVTLGNSHFIHKHGLGRFHDGLAWLMQLALFLTLGLLVNPSDLKEYWLSGTLLVFFLILIARPASVFVSLCFSRFNFREKILISCGGIRGAAPILLSLYPVVSFGHNPELQKQAIQNFNLVFFAVIWSVLIQGKTLMKLAKWLKLGIATETVPRPPLEFEETGLSTSQMYEFNIKEDSPALHKPIKELELPENVLVYLIRRDGVFIVPRGKTIIEQDDALLMLIEPSVAPTVEPLFLAKVGE